MKKFMALVLALVMVLGLATVGTNAAAYKDANDITKKEAVEVMSAVGVFKGDENGFRPADTLKRSEGAKLIAYLLLGNKTAEAMQGSGNKFSDVPATHWACGYIEYLASVGVISGVGDGKFDPDGQLTATQFAKMLLIALGYDAELEKLVGGEWSINTQKLANSNDLFDALEDLVGSEPVNRECAAQLCLNTLKATMVEYADKGTTVKIGESTVVTGASNARKVGAVGNRNMHENADVYKQLAEDLYGSDLKIEVETDAFGAPANKWTYKSEEVGTFAANDDVIFTANGEVKTNAMYNAIGKTAYDRLEDATDKLLVFVDGEGQWANAAAWTAAFAEANIGNFFQKDTSAKVLDLDDETALTGKGSTLTIYKTKTGDNENMYTVVIKNTYAVQATADYNAKNEYVNIAVVDSMGGDEQPAIPNIPTKIEQEDFDVSGVKEDDYLIVTFADGDIQSVAPATVVEGKVSAYTEGKNVTIDGTKYEYNMKVNATGKGETFDIDSTAKIILDTFGYIVCVDEAEGTGDFVYLQDVEPNKNNNATLYFTDGTSKTVTVKKIGDEASYNAFGAAMRGWYTYSVDSNNRYTLKTLVADDYAQSVMIGYAANAEITIKNQVAFLDGQGVKGNTSTVVIVLDNDEDVTVYTGVTNIPGMKVKAGEEGVALVRYFTETGKTFAKYVFIDASLVKTVVDDSSATDNYLFVLKTSNDKNSVAGDKEYTEFKVLLDGEQQTIKVNYEDRVGYTAGVLYKNAKTNSDGWYTTASDFVPDDDQLVATECTYIKDDSDEYKIAYSSNVLSIGNEDYVVDSNTKIKLIYKKGFEAMKDTAADFEVSDVTGNGLASALKGIDAYEYDFYGTLAEKDSTKLTTLYVWVYEVED